MNDNFIKVSIIIPIYNTAEYLEECLESVLHQTLKEMEFICVDDGSTDDTPLILERYASVDERIRIIHKENGGLVSARKAGVVAANGKYIGFVDSDDWVEVGMYEKLYHIAEDNSVDMVTCGFFLEGNYTTTHMDTISQGLYSGKDMQTLREHAIYNFEKRSSGLKASLCYKLFKKQLIQDAQSKIPNDITMAEDKVCMLTALLKCQSVYVYHQAFYHYRIRGNSIVHTGSEDYLLKVHAVYKYIKGLYSNILFTENMRKQVELYITELLYKGINTLLGFETKNLLWIDPYWLDEIPCCAKLMLYGAGELGEKYRKQMRSRKDIQYVACIDAAYKRLNSSDFRVEPPEIALSCDYDYIVITIKNFNKAQTVKKELQNIGIPEDKILWFDQTEFFWKFARAEGWLDDEE